MFQKILVPLDGSDLAEQALETAVLLAGKASGELFLLQAVGVNRSVVPDPTGYSYLWPELSLDEIQKQSEAYLTAVAERIARPDLTVTIRAREGDPAGSILDTATAEATDLIIMSTHGYSGLTRWVLGSVTEKVLRHAPCPVLALRTATAIRHVMITLDGSKLAESALTPAIELAASLGAVVTLLQVAEEPPPTDAVEMVERDRPKPDVSELVDPKRLAEIERYLKRLAAEHGRPDLTIQTAVASGPPGAAILAQTEQRDVDVVGMSTHGRTGLRRWVYGSITEKVLRGADRAILVVRPPDEALT